MIPRAICVVCGKGGPRHEGVEKSPVRPLLVVWGGPPFYIHVACAEQRLDEVGARR